MWNHTLFAGIHSTKAPLNIRSCSQFLVCSCSFVIICKDDVIFLLISFFFRFNFLFGFNVKFWCYMHVESIPHEWYQFVELYCTFILYFLEVIIASVQTSNRNRNNSGNSISIFLKFFIEMFIINLIKKIGFDIASSLFGCLDEKKWIQQKNINMVYWNLHEFSSNFHLQYYSRPKYAAIMFIGLYEMFVKLHLSAFIENDWI